MDPSVVPSVPATPQLTPVFLANCKITIGPSITDKVKDKTVNLVPVVDGYIETVKNPFGFELEVQGITGFDDITTHISDNYNTLDCKIYGKTPEGAGVYITYEGVIKLEESLVNVMTGKAKGSRFEDTYLTSNPRIHFDGDVPEKYKWAVSENLIGKGRFVRDANDNMYVQYYVYVIR